VLLRRAKELEEAGRFDGSQAGFGRIWQRVEIGQARRSDGASRAEMLCALGLCRAGSEAPARFGAQEAAKDLISESSAIFEELGLAEK